MTTPEKIENYLLITIDEDFKPKVQEFIDSVTAYIERYTGRSFTAVTEDTEIETRIYDGTGTGELFINDATEITEVRIDNRVIDTDNYRLYPANRLPKTRIIMPSYNFSTGAQNVSIKGKFGYVEIPKDLAFAATVIASGIVNFQNTDDKDIQSETIGRYSVTYRTGTNQEHDFQNAKNILKLYRRMS